MTAKAILSILIVVLTAVVTSNVEPIRDLIHSNQLVETIVQGVYGLLALVVTSPLVKKDVEL